MLRIKPGGWVVILVIGFVGMACNLPFVATPTPFVFPTPNMTMTALFAPTATAVPPTTTQIPPTATPVPPTNTPVPPTETDEPTQELVNNGPDYPPPPVYVPDHRSSPNFEAQYVKEQPALDGGLGDWSAEKYSANNVVFGAEHWKNSADLSSYFMVEWDKQYLYVAWKVHDDKYVQTQKHTYLYLGDSVEILMDTDVESDYWTQWLNSDDYQIGISPGRKAVGENMEAYRWFPNTEAGQLNKAIIGAKTISGGYQVTVGIPWKNFGITPYEGMRVGFAASVSDDDSKSGGDQQSMVSSSWRVLTDPTTWGDLELVK
jgi:hypothetical protein